MGYHSFSLVLLIFVCALKFCVGQYAVPNIEFEAFSPKGLKISIPADKGVELFGFHGKLNKPILQIEPGEFSEDVTRPVNGKFTYFNPSIKLKEGDNINYWVFIQHDQLGFRKDDQTWKVDKLTSNDPSGTNNNNICGNSITKVLGKPNICSGDEIVNYKFTESIIDPLFWQLEQYIPSGPIMDLQKRKRWHWDVLLNLLEERPEMVTGKFVCQNARQKSTELWENAATMLNALGLGEKTPDKWKVALQDWKYKTKMKVAEIKKHENKTGGGPQIKIKFSEQEERLMNIVGWTTALGNENVPESGLTPIQKNNLSVDEARSKAGTSSLQKLQLETELSDMTYYSEKALMDTQDEILIINVEAHKPISATSNKRPKPERSTNRTSSRINDPLHTYQKETMAVLKDISNGIKKISSDLKSISESLAIIANKLQ